MNNLKRIYNYSLIFILLLFSIVSCTTAISDEELEIRFEKAYEAKNWETVVDLLNEKIKRTPDDPALYFLRAQSYSNFDNDKANEMIVDLNKYLSYHPDNYVARFLKAQALMIESDFSEAIKELDTIINEVGKNAMLLAWKGNAAFAGKKFDLAEQAYYERLKLPGAYEDLKLTYYYWMYSKYFGGNKEGALWDCAFLDKRGFNENPVLMEAITKDRLNFEELSLFSIPNMTLEQIDELLTNNCDGIDIFKGKNYFRSELLEELAHLDKTEDLSSLLEQKEDVFALNLRYSGFTELPEELFQFVNLQALDVSGNRFQNKEKLFEDLSKLPNLKVLSLGRCNLRNLPDNISLLQNLEVFVVYTNGFRSINENIGQLKKLKLLDVSNNSLLTDLPSSIGQLRCLKRLDVAGSGLKRLRDELANCTELVSISANACKIRTLPQQIGNLINLRHFNLGHNKIAEIPPSYAELSALREISLGSNDLRQLPKEITNLQQVERVSLDFNRFKTFPIEILELENVYSVWIHNNAFKEIPLDLAKMPKIQRILIDHQIITDDNITALKDINPDLLVIKEDSRKYVKGPKRKN